jgi:uncharacterized membrane protein (UPF0136 family)
MEHPHKVNMVNGIILITAGLIGFFSNPSYPLTALISPAFGLVFILLNPAMKKGNKIVIHLIVVLTLLLGIMVTMVFFRAAEPAFDRRSILLAIMALSCYVSFAFYLANFIKARMDKGNTD